MWWTNTPALELFGLITSRSSLHGSTIRKSRPRRSPSPVIRTRGAETWRRLRRSFVHHHQKEKLQSARSKDAARLNFLPSLVTYKQNIRRCGVSYCEPKDNSAAIRPCVG